MMTETRTARERALEALAATGQDMVKVDGRWFKLYRGQALDITRLMSPEWQERQIEGC